MDLWGFSSRSCRSSWTKQTHKNGASNVLVARVSRKNIEKTKTAQRSQEATIPLLQTPWPFLLTRIGPPATPNPKRRAARPRFRPSDPPAVSERSLDALFVRSDFSVAPTRSNRARAPFQAPRGAGRRSESTSLRSMRSGRERVDRGKTKGGAEFGRCGGHSERLFLEDHGMKYHSRAPPGFHFTRSSRTPCTS